MEKKVTLFNGAPIRDYIYVEDVVEAIILSLENSFSGILNLGTGKGTSSSTIAKEISKMTNSEIEDLNRSLEWKKRVVLDIEKAQKILNWGPMIDIREGLEKTIDYYREKIIK